MKALFTSFKEQRYFETSIQVQGIKNVIMGYVEITCICDFPGLSHLLFCFHKDAATYAFINM